MNMTAFTLIHQVRKMVAEKQATDGVLHLVFPGQAAEFGLGGCDGCAACYSVDTKLDTAINDTSELLETYGERAIPVYTLRFKGETDASGEHTNTFYHISPNSKGLKPLSERDAEHFTQKACDALELEQTTKCKVIAQWSGGWGGQA
jgi:hypothetical protein